MQMARTFQTKVWLLNQAVHVLPAVLSFVTWLSFIISVVTGY